MEKQKCLHLIELDDGIRWFEFRRNGFLSIWNDIFAFNNTLSLGSGGEFYPLEYSQYSPVKKREKHINIQVKKKKKVTRRLNISDERLPMFECVVM